MIDIARLSSRYEIRVLGEADAEEILRLCRANTLFYQYCEARPTREQILNDLRVTPPGKDRSDKYYLGFYRGGTLMAVLDLIDGYPEPGIAFLGFFMMNAAFQGRGLGSEIITELAAALQAMGRTALRLGIDKGNPQSTHFWKKNGFSVIREVERPGWTVLLAEKALRDGVPGRQSETA